MPFLIACISASITGASALTESTPEGVALMNIASSVTGFEEEHKRLPRDWKELSDAWQRPLDEVFPKVLPTVRYEYFHPPLRLRFNEHQTIEVLAMTRKPMMEMTSRQSFSGYTTALKGPGRYLIRRDPENRWRQQWLEESRIQVLWPGTGHALPLPDAEPERKWVTKARAEILTRRIGLAVAAAVPLLWIAFRIRRRIARS